MTDIFGGHLENGGHIEKIQVGPYPVLLGMGWANFVPSFMLLSQFGQKRAQIRWTTLFRV